jgi:UDP-N-acetyl-D-mannosaminuronate dehydrogenase
VGFKKKNSLHNIKKKQQRQLIMKIAFLGMGEIGAAVAKVYNKSDASHTLVYRDPKLNLNDSFDGVDVLNVCIPYFTEAQFVTAVSNTIEECNPKLTIIHSSVQPSCDPEDQTTVQKIISKSSSSGVVHSPVRGVHPDLYGGLMTFVKFIGAETESVGSFAKEHMESLGMKTQVTSSRNTELAKLLSTSYYGVCIAFTEEMGRLCDQSGADFDVVVKDWNQTYNDGYSELGKKNVVRPVLFRLSSESPTIGGHCVIPNAKLLKRKFDTDVFDPVLKFGNYDHNLDPHKD